jgi:hypothetical protein
MFAARAQQKTPVIRYMGNSTAALEANLTNAFREGLRDAGYEEGRNAAIKYLAAHRE